MFSPALEMALNVARREAISRRHLYLTLEHMLYALVHDPEGEKILVACGADVTALKRGLETFFDEVLEQLPPGVMREPDQTVAFRTVLRTAILHVQSSGRKEATAGDVLAAVLQQPRSTAASILASQGVTRLDILRYISHGIAKIPMEEPAGRPEGAEEHGPAAAGDVLAAYCVNLTELARTGKLDPLIGRTAELRRTIEVLCRRRKNNPVFVGDTGVGKTALAEGLAGRLLEDDIPPALKGAEIFAMDTGTLLAGTRYRGDFEERFKNVVTALKKRQRPIIFIDEIHTLIGTGSASGGTLDLANLIKPVIADGSLRVVGSSTFEEFKHIEKDRALARRFRRIVVEEPSVDETIKILKGLRNCYEEHHQVTYTEEALEACVRLAQRHLRGQRLPDSAIDVLDEAGAMMKLQPPHDDTRKVIDIAEIEKIVSGMAGIPVQQASASEKKRLKTLEEGLRRVVFGQDDAVATVATSIKRSRAGLGQPERPVGCFLFAGPTGVGKTELAKQLALHLGNEFIRYDMSEYMEKHAVARLIGAPPGYVGFEQGGLLVDAVRAHPYCVVLLDEIEKAHPDVFNILLQVMDHATLTDNNGRKADFRHTVLIMTTNAGSREMSEGSIGFGENRRGDARARSRSAVEKTFSPEFRNRLDAVVSFDPLTIEIMEMIVEKFILQVEAQLAERHVAIALSPEARDWLARKGHDPIYGARPLARLIQAEVRNPLTEEILFGKLENGGTVTIGCDADRLTFAYEGVPAAPAPEMKAAPEPEKEDGTAV